LVIFLLSLIVGQIAPPVRSHHWSYDLPLKNDFQNATVDSGRSIVPLACYSRWLSTSYENTRNSSPFVRLLVTSIHRCTAFRTRLFFKAVFHHWCTRCNGKRVLFVEPDQAKTVRTEITTIKW